MPASFDQLVDMRGCPLTFAGEGRRDCPQCAGWWHPYPALGDSRPRERDSSQGRCEAQP